jgi:acetolactate decarboxylase
MSAQVADSSWQVSWFGSQKDFITGSAAEPISLRRFAQSKNLYALGPLEGARGEISVFDSLPAIAKVEPEGIRIDSDFGYRAGFLVYATVENWSGGAELGAIDTEADLLKQLLALSESRGIDIDSPFPFLINGQIDQVKFHVLCNRSNGKYSPELHEKSKVRFEIQQQSVEIIGFHSRRHRGVFTPPNSDLHMHMRTSDNRLAGHIDYVRWENPVSVRVPVNTADN